MPKGGGRVQTLEEICKEWAPRLGLGHWEISIRWADEKDIEEMGPWADAHVKYKFCVERAAIRVKKEEDCKPIDASDSYDAEELIVHELLHLVFAHFPDGEPDELKTDLFDTGIDRIAKALVRLKRGE
ncbi:MAG: hypothetical protein K6E42_08110 [Synergistes sp.]|nr:hypothetical protein [Synergistes sp.]